MVSFENAIHYSTVTDFARLRGLSTSRPLKLAHSYAISWKGIAVKIGIR